MDHNSCSNFNCYCCSNCTNGYDTYQPPEDSDPLEVVAMGHQWWWEFIFHEGIVTANELFIPTDRPIRITLQSQDVIHSFWVPGAERKILFLEIPTLCGYK